VRFLNSESTFGSDGLSGPTESFAFSTASQELRAEVRAARRCPQLLSFGIIVDDPINIPGSFLAGADKSCARRASAKALDVFPHSTESLFHGSADGGLGPSKVFRNFSLRQRLSGTVAGVCGLPPNNECLHGFYAG
jgi:hypothetical protein